LGQAAGRGVMTAAVFVPGLLCTGDAFARQCAAFDRDLDIQIADHTGQDSIGGMASAILAAAPERFVLVGLSLGGIIALEMMVQAGDRVSGLVLVDTGARADSAEQAERRAAFVGFAEQAGLRAAMEKSIPLMLHEKRQNDERLRETLFNMAESSGLEVFERQQRALAGRRDYRADLAKIASPTLVMVGEADAMTPVDRARELADGIGRARLEIIAGCGHLSTLECPDEVNGHIASFLRDYALLG